MADLFSRLTGWIAEKATGRTIERGTVRGIPVIVANTRPDIPTALVIQRLDAALGVIESSQPWRFRHLQRDFSEILVQRFPCRGAFFPDSRTCLTELTFLANPDFNEAQIAASIVHEGMHARVHASLSRAIARGDDHPVIDRKPREERLCRRAEREFGLVAPGGEPVVERALATLQMEDDDVAPAIDWTEASRRVADADRQAGG
jgi:hypothetical protein